MPFFHFVFTLPAAIGDIAHQNKRVIYDLLFKASAETMLTIAAWRGAPIEQVSGRPTVLVAALSTLGRGFAAPKGFAAWLTGSTIAGRAWPTSAYSGRCIRAAADPSASCE